MKLLEYFSNNMMLQELEKKQVMATKKINEKYLWGFDAGGTKTFGVWDYTR